MMKRVLIYCLLTLALFAFFSCRQRQTHCVGFHDEANDSIYFDLGDYVLPASFVTLYSAVKINNKYYLLFEETERVNRGGAKNILVEFSEDLHKPGYIPLPVEVRYPSLTSRNDSLVIRDSRDEEFAYDSKRGSWIKVSCQSKPLYEDEEYIVRYVDRGEFGCALWFIEKDSGVEYAFVGMDGRVCRINGSFYIVGRTRIYEIDPSKGFQCDSMTRYEQLKDVRLIFAHFLHAGYLGRKSQLPIVHFDDVSADVCIGSFTDVRSDTTIIGSFVSSDTLFCALQTPSGLSLTKLKNGGLDLVHQFKFDIGGDRPVSIFQNEYPQLMWHSRYRVCDSPLEEKLLILVNRKDGLSELIDMSKDGNSFVNLLYKSSQLPAVEDDSFGTLLSSYLEHWGRLSFDDILALEGNLGGLISHRGLERTRNSYPPDSLFHNNESYHIDIISKGVDGQYEVESEYFIRESDNAVVAVFMDWYRSRNQSSFDSRLKYDELSEIISNLFGPGTLVAQTTGKIQYMEWQSAKCTARLYGNDYQVRFIFF